MNMMIMSPCEISVVINVRLYDRQDEFKTGVRKETCPEIYNINPYTPSDWEMHCTRDQNVTAVKPAGVRKYTVKPAALFWGLRV